MKVTFRSSKSTEPDRERGVRVPYGPAKRAVARWRWYLVVVLVSTPLLYLMGQIFYTTVVVTASGFVTLEKVPINTQIAGWLSHLGVRVGEEVVPGRVLATLSSPELLQREQLLRAEAATHDLSSPPPSGASALQELEKGLRLSQEVVDYHQAHIKKVRFLYDQGAATIAELNLAQSNLQQAEANLQQMRSAMALRRLEDLRLHAPDRVFETRAKLIEAELQTLEEQKNRLSHKSPVRGRVLEVFAEVGQSFSQGQPLLMLGSLERPSVQAYLDSKHLKYAQSGQKAVATLNDGRSYDVVVRQKPELTGRLPAAAVPALGERQFMLLVILDFVAPLAPDDTVDNLPVTVRFPFRL